MEGLQVFRKRGRIILVKCGFIAVDIPYEWKIKDAEIRGTSIVGTYSYYDIALNEICELHIMRKDLDGSRLATQAFFFNKYPF